MIDDIGLTLNVITPPDATPDSKLPVVVVSFEGPLPIILLIDDHEQWFYPGAFEFGGTVRYVQEFLRMHTTIITHAHTIAGTTATSSWRKQSHSASPLYTLA